MIKDAAQILTERLQRASAPKRGTNSRGKYTPGIMPPWDENLYFDTPKITNFIHGGGAAIRVCDANPRRVGIIFSSPNAGANSIQISIDSQFVFNNGIVIPNSQVPFVLLQKDVGLITSVEWFFLSSGGGKISVLEIILNKWPGG